MTLNSLLSLGIIFLSGIAFAALIKKIRLPSITAYLIMGIFMGPHALNLISQNLINTSGLISNIVLSLIAFNIGQNFSRDRIRDIGRDVFWITVGQGFGAVIFVALAVYFFTHEPLIIAVCLGAIATATAPAAVVMVVREFRSKGKFTNTLLGVVALDDGMGLMLFAIIFAVMRSIAGIHGGVIPLAFSGVIHGVVEIIGAVGLGLTLGYILSLFSRHVTSPSELLIYTLGFVLFNAGVSLVMGFSVLLSNMAMAAILININTTSFKFFDSLRSIDSPFYLLFFVLAGANLEIHVLGEIGVLGLVYILSRLLGKFVGAFVSAQAIGTSKKVRNYLGIGLAPQAGVALGMAMIVKSVFPREGGLIMSTIVATTVIYEIIGPVLTQFALVRAGDIEK